MSQFWKFSSILAVLALLVVMGLSTSPQAVQAQAAGAPSEDYICSNNQGGCTLFARTAAADPADPTTGAPVAGTSTGDNLFEIAAVTGGSVTIHNLDLPRVDQKVHTAASTAQNPQTVDGPDANPKTIPIDSDVVIEAVHQSSGLVDARCDINGATGAGSNDSAYDQGECTTGNAYQVKAFNGNRIQVSHTPSGGTFATIETVRVDNGRPSLVSNSPAPGLIVKGNTDITFSADITDSISGYTPTNTAAAGIHTMTGSAEPLNDGTGTGTANDETVEGGVRLVVAGNVVGLDHTNFTKIDGGWRVSKTINSTALQAIATNVPWYFETRDQANNVQRTSGSVSGTVGATSAGGTIVDARWTGNLVDGTFLGTNVRVSRKVGANTIMSNAQPVTFTGGVITVTNDITSTPADPLFDDAVENRYSDSNGDGTIDTSSGTSDTVIPATAGYQCPLDARDTIVLGPLSTTAAQTVTVTQMGARDDNTGSSQTPPEDDQIDVCQPMPKDSYEILGTNLITIDSVSPELASGSSVVTGRGYDAPGKPDKAQRNSIKVTFTDLGKAGSSAPGSGIDPDTVSASAFSVSGHTVESVRTVGNSVYLTLADDLGSTERPVVAIAGSLIKDRAGNALLADQKRAVDQLGPNLSLSKSADLSNDKVTVTITTDEQLNATPTVYVTKAAASGAAPTMGTTAKGPVRQTGAQSYSYTHEDSDGGEFSVYVTASDTSEVMSTVGDSDSSADPGSFTFELDKQLNDNMPPQFNVASVEDVANKSGIHDDVEQVDPLIVTVDFEMEGDEYDRDSYRTVTLTSAKLSIRLPDGTTENRTLNLTTDVTTPDNVQFTFPLLNPKIGAYTMTVQAMDEAGNTRVQGSADLKASWDVVKPKPVNVNLQPGWNLVSLPFQPANPAINSVIGTNHPADIVMTFDNASQVWLVSRRDAETGSFMGDIAVMTANTAYFIRTENFQPISVLRPPLATAAAAPPPPPAIQVVEGWNLVPIVSNDASVPAGIAADDYFGTLGGGSNAGWLKALTFDTLSRTWMSVTPNDTMTLTAGDTNPCTGKKLDAGNVADQTEPCQVGAYTERSTTTDDVPTATPPTYGTDGQVGVFDVNDRVVLKAEVTVGKGYWLYATADGVIIP